MKKFELLGTSKGRGIKFVTFCSPYTAGKDEGAYDEFIIHQGQKDQSGEWKLFNKAFVNGEFTWRPIHPDYLPGAIEFLEANS